MDNLSLADRLRLIWFEAALQRWPVWMLAALIDAARYLESEPPRPELSEAAPPVVLPTPELAWVPRGERARRR